MLAVMPKQPSTPKRRRGRPSLPNALTMPLTVKINPAIYQGLLSINDDARIALRLVAILKLLEMKVISISDIPESAQGELPGIVKHGPKGRGAK
jgi:hypothetical protein